MFCELIIFLLLLLIELWSSSLLWGALCPRFAHFCFHLSLAIKQANKSASSGGGGEGGGAKCTSSTE